LGDVRTKAPGPGGESSQSAFRLEKDERQPTDEHNTTTSTRAGAAAPGHSGSTPASQVEERDTATRQPGAQSDTRQPAAQSDERQLAAQSDKTDALRREEFGGFNRGADFLGWLAAVALTVLVASIVGAIAAVGSSLHVDQTGAERKAGTFGIATAIALLVILMLAYYAGGYVAGRMSRFDGGRQGFGVWLIGLFVTIVAVVVGLAFGAQYNIFQRVDLPSIPIPSDKATWRGLIALAAVLLGTLLAAFTGGKVGRRYHTKWTGSTPESWVAGRESPVEIVGAAGYREQPHRHIP
jgi:hypothetical protein